MLLIGAFRLAIILATLAKIQCLLEDDENDTVVVDAVLRRNPRHLYIWNYRNTWSKYGEGSACISSANILGQCKSFGSCYSHSRMADVRAWEKWVTGNYDTCTYFNDKGFQAFGTCCTTNVIGTADEQETYLNGINTNYYPNWPPEPITHGPDHTPATHPPSHFNPTHPATSTQKPSTVWWPTSPPTTTKAPTTSTQTIWWHPPSTSKTTTTTTKRPPYPGWPAAQLPNDDSGSYGGTCGDKNGSADQERIVGGQNADPNEWPWIAVLFNGGRQFCGGSLIDDEHILTAAHCIAHFTSWDVAQLTVHLGDHNIRSTTEVKHLTRKVKRLVRHRGFDSRTLYNDIAILTLDSPVKFTRAVHPVCLPSGAGTYNGQQATVVGWGSIRENGPQPSILQEVMMPIWSNVQCAQKYGASAPGGIVESMLCAGVFDKDSCSGDSGGPLVINEGRWTQVGIVSWGIGCGKGQYPGVYTRVSSFLPWIQKNTAAN